MKKWLGILLSMMLVCTCALAEYPVTVTDQAGRTVTIEKQPETLVSGYYIASSALMALGQTNRLVGIEAKAGSRPIYRLSAPQLLELPDVGTAKQFNLEVCAALNPDLVILPIKLKSAVEQLEALDIPVLLVNPENGELLADMLDMMIQATGCEEQGAALQDCISGIQTMLGEKLADVDRQRVYLAGNASLLSTAGAAMYQSALLEMAGGENVALELTDTYWAEIDYEQLLAWDPEVIVLASDAAYSVDDVVNDPNLADCKAIVNHAVYQMPNAAEAWDSPVPSSVLGAAWLASVLHPDVMAMDETMNMVGTYYETFYGFSYPQD